MDVSIIIVNYKTVPLILDCLRSVYQYIEHLSFEIIVVDTDRRQIEANSLFFNINPFGTIFRAENRREGDEAMHRPIIELSLYTIEIGNAAMQNINDRMIPIIIEKPFNP